MTLGGGESKPPFGKSGSEGIGGVQAGAEGPGASVRGKQAAGHCGLGGGSFTFIIGEGFIPSRVPTAGWCPRRVV